MLTNMDNLHKSGEETSSSNLSQENEIKLENTLYHSEASNSHNLQDVNNLSQSDSGSYGTQINFTAMNIKEEDIEESGNELVHPSVSYQSASVPVIASTSPIKVNPNPILNTEVAMVSQGMQLTSGGSMLTNTSESCNKVLSNHQSIIPLGQNVHFNSSLNLSNPVSQRSSNVTCRQNTDMNQSVQMFQSSFDNNEGVLSQQQQQHSGQTFILASPGTVLSSNHVVSQGQVFLQGDDLVGVTLATTAATTGYTVSNSESQYVNTLPMVLSGGQAIGNSIPRLIIQSNQTGTPNLNNQILASNNGHYLIQVGHSLPAVSQNNNFSINNKGHIVIKAGSSKAKEEPENISSSSKDGVFRVVIPEGTTKLPRLSQPLQVVGSTDDSIRQHVQINLSNRASAPSPTKVSHNDTAVQTLKETKVSEKMQVNSGRKLYECPNCNSKFMKPLYLRMHTRSCKPPEMKLEKSPLFMCSFCKATFKTKPQINHHFTKCSQSPYKDVLPGKRKIEEEEENTCSKKAKVCEVDVSLEMAVQYKCQDCDRTFSKERQYTSHIKRCTKVSVHDLSGARLEPPGCSTPEEEPDSLEDPFADPLPPPPPSKRGRGGGGRRGRPPGRVTSAAQKVALKSDILFGGEKVEASCPSLVVADNENLVRSTTGLAHTIQLSLETAHTEGRPRPMALVADSKGVRGRDSPPYAWSLVCSLCQKMYLTKPALANHMIENHGPDLRATRNILIGVNTEEKLYKCPLCNLHYQSSNTFIEHLVVQHTSKLQDHYKNLQAQTATFVCSLCSLVLLTKNLLMEHLSLEHLDHLEKTHLNSKQLHRQNKRKQIHNPVDSSANGEVKEEENLEMEESGEDLEKDKYPLELKSEGGGNSECGFCGEEFESGDLLITHYAHSHGVQADSNGAILDVGLDVDIRVKDTRHLLQLVDGKDSAEAGASLPQKTVLIRKKPKQSWQCQRCQQVFSRQMTWLRHIRESCSVSNHSGSESGKATPSRESHFFCHEPECSHLAFYQVKSLFKHIEDVHKTVVLKERKTFRSLSAFQQWLTEEEDTRNVRFIRDSTRIEKGNVRLIQMVCHRFHSAKSEQAREKEESDLSKPTKKRWFARIQRANNCHARIHLRAELNATSGDYDGETQMIYYPQHFHNGEEDTPEILERVREKHPRDKWLGGSAPSGAGLRNSTQANSGNSNCFAEGDSGSSFSLDSTSDILQLHNDDTSSESQQQQSKSQPMQECPRIAAPPKGNPPPTSGVFPHRSSLIFEGGEQPQATPLTEKRTLVSDGPPSVIVPPSEGETSFLADEASEFSEEYVLPADDAEWTKLFEVLATRLSSGELTEAEQKEGETLLSSRNLIAVVSLSEQVSIFQRMCALTNTSLESV